MIKIDDKILRINFSYEELIFSFAPWDCGLTPEILINNFYNNYYFSVFFKISYFF